MNIIQKSLILGAQGAVIIILAYLIALSEIELSINIPAVVAPTSSVAKLAEQKPDISLAEVISTSSPVMAKMKTELLDCMESATTSLVYVAPHPFVEPIKAEMTANLKIKGLDDAGFCHIDQEIVKTTMFLTPEDKQAALAAEGGMTEADIEQMLGAMNEEYVGMPVVVSDCYGTAENLFAYFQALEQGGGVGNVSSSFSTSEGSINVMEDYQVTCVTPLMIVEEEGEASSTEEVLAVPED